MAEAFDAVRAECFEASQSLFGCFLSVEMGLAEKFVGIADELLFECFGQEILRGKRKVLSKNGSARDARSGVTLANAGMTWESFGTEHVGTETTVKNIGRGAMAMDAGRIAMKNADVVQQGGFFEKRAVDGQFGVPMGNVKCELGNAATVDEEELTQRTVDSVVFVDECLWIHICEG